jgi:hypothetical protein
LNYNQEYFMPACPSCQTPYESGARFCQQCGAALPQTEPISPGPLAEPEATPTAEAAPEASQPLSQKINPRLLAIFGGAAVVIIIAAIFLFKGSGTPPPEPGPSATKEAVSPEADLQQQLGQVLGTLREAQINKDIARFMDCYAAGFPGREEKRQEALKVWTEFDFTAMFFYLEEVQPAGSDTARAKVTWDLQVQDKHTQEVLTSSQTFQTEFVKEQGTWRIRSLQEISTP